MTNQTVIQIYFNYTFLSNPPIYRYLSNRFSRGQVDIDIKDKAYSRKVILPFEGNEDIF